MELLFTALIVLSHFDPNLPKLNDYATKSKPDLVQMYNHACLELFARPEFKDLDIQQLLQTVLNDSPQLRSSGLSSKIDVAQVIDLYKKICKPQPEYAALHGLDADIAQAQEHYQQLLNEVYRIKMPTQIQLPQATDILSSDGRLLTEIYQPQARRKWVSLQSLPRFVPMAFVAVEDRRYFEHHGADEIGILRALMKSFMSRGRPEGASTITQQVARNLFLDSKLSMDRKLKEILIADRMEDLYTKEQILEVYINLIYFGRNSWGIEKAAQSYFSKPAAKLTIPELAYLVGIVQGPNLYQSHPNRIEARVNFTLEKFAEAGIIPAPMKINLEKDLKFKNDGTSINANYFRDYLTAQLKLAKAEALLEKGGQLPTTLNAVLQEIATTALQTGLIDYEKRAERYFWKGPITNIASEMDKNLQRINSVREGREMEQSKAQDSLFGSVITTEDDTVAAETVEIPTDVKEEIYWLAPLQSAARVHAQPVRSWRLAVALDNMGRIGLSDGTEGILNEKSMMWITSFDYGDLHYVIPAGQGQYELIQAPDINGAVVVMDPRTGNILSMVGGFSYALSPWNRAALAFRQPGSLVKPFTYMAALQNKIQPNILLDNASLLFPPTARGGQSWQPKNYDNTAKGPMPMRWALERSVNTMTAQLMNMVGLDSVRSLMKSFGLYENPATDYPVILGSQESTLLNLVKVYGEIANQGQVLSPRFLKADAALPSSVNAFKEQGPANRVAGVDDITLFQIRYLLQGVTASGSAARLNNISQYVAGKTGTTDELRDVWFIGFTQDLVVGVYVGYDEPQTLGGQSAGSSVALPIAEKILRKSFEVYKKPVAFPGPPAGVVMFPTDKVTGELKPAMDKNTVLEAYRGN